SWSAATATRSRGPRRAAPPGSSSRWQPYRARWGGTARPAPAAGSRVRARIVDLAGPGGPGGPGTPCAPVAPVRSRSRGGSCLQASGARLRRGRKFGGCLAAVGQCEVVQPPLELGITIEERRGSAAEAEVVTASSSRQGEERAGGRSVAAGKTSRDLDSLGFSVMSTEGLFPQTHRSSQFVRFALSRAPLAQAVWLAVAAVLLVATARLTYVTGGTQYSYLHL